MRQRGLGVGVCGLLLACGGAAPSEPAKAGSPDPAATPEPATPPDIQAMLMREAEGLEEKAVSGPGGAWTARVLAAAPPTVTDRENAWELQVSLGTEAFVVCQVFKDAVDLGGTIGQVLQTADEKVDYRRVAPRSMWVVGEAPVVAVDAIYTVAGPNGKALGELKVAIYAAAGHPILCLHDELGYRQTLDKLMTGLCESFKAAHEQRSEAAYVELQTGSIGELPVGFEKHVLTREGGSQRMTTTGALFVPTNETSLLLVDNYVIEKIDAAGYLEEGHWIEATGGELSMNLKVTRVKGSKYRYEGELQGKPIHGEFKVKDPKGLPSSLATAQKLVREIAKPGGFSLVEQGYIPDVDPTQAYEVRYRRAPSDPPGVVHLEAGRLKFSGHVDEHGMFDSIELPVGPASVHFKRQMARGKP